MISGGSPAARPRARPALGAGTTDAFAALLEQAGAAARDPAVNGTPLQLDPLSARLVALLGASPALTLAQLEAKLPGVSAEAVRTAVLSQVRETEGEPIPHSVWANVPADTLPAQAPGPKAPGPLAVIAKHPERSEPKRHPL